MSEVTCHCSLYACKNTYLGKSIVMDFEGYTFVFLSKYKQNCPHPDVIYITLLLFNQRTLFLKCKLPLRQLISHFIVSLLYEKNKNVQS